MWRNFIRVTIRSISKNKAFNAINIAGLAIGLASAIFIILYIISETSYDPVSYTHLTLPTTPYV